MPLIRQNVPTWVTREMNLMELNGVKEFLDECSRGGTWEFEGEKGTWEFESSTLLKAKNHIDSLQ